MHETELESVYCHSCLFWQRQSTRCVDPDKNANSRSTLCPLQVPYREGCTSAKLASKAAFMCHVNLQFNSMTKQETIKVSLTSVHQFVAMPAYFHVNYFLLRACNMLLKTSVVIVYTITILSSILTFLL